MFTTSGGINKMEFKRFKIKDVVFLAVMAALLFACSAVAMPLMSIALFGLRNMATAVFYGVFATLAVMKVRKPCALTLLGFFNSVILLMMSPVMFVTNIVSTVLSELIALLIFKSYDSDMAAVTAASLMIPITLPFSAVFSVIMNGTSFSEVFGNSWLIALTCAGTVVLSVLDALKELRKAGKI